MRSRQTTLVVLACGAAFFVGCAAGPSEKDPAFGGAAGSHSSGERAPKSMDPKGLLAMTQPSFLVPELSQNRGVFLREEGHTKILIDRMRIVLYDDGRQERSTELLSNVYASAIELPSRLGGGFLFQSASGGSTQIWRSPSWLGHLEPVIAISPPADEIIAGFDRLYVRQTSYNRLTAIDLKTGKPMPLGPLPQAVAYGQLAFADGWRAVVDADLRGPLITFDAGTSWRPLGLTERPSLITAITGDPTVFVGGGKYVIDAVGAIRFHADVRRGAKPSDTDDAEKLPRPPGPLGKKPLRTAIEDGFPSDERTAIVARGGSLARVSLTDGSILKLQENAYRERDATCHAIRVGEGFGFVCGVQDGATSIYGFEKPFGMKALWRFEKPRFVAPSGNGALVVRGPCESESAGPSQGRTYCVRGVDGATRQIRINGDAGAERVVALADGRVVVLVPPRKETGQIMVLRGSAVESSAPLKFPARPSDSVRAAKRGLWQDSFEEREPGSIGGWIEAGGITVGVRVETNGNVKLGETRGDENGAVVSSRFGLSLGSDGEAAESIDGGMTWTSFELPTHTVDAPARTRACGPVGCALGSWLRVGWGSTLVKDDFESARAPSTLKTVTKAASTISVSCELLGSVTPPIPEKPQTPAVAGKKGYATPPPPRYSYSRYGYGYSYKPPWLTFRNTPAPTLLKDEVGVDTGTYGENIGLRSYAWGKKGADWTKIGKWLVRFDDRFDVSGGVRTTATTVLPWSDEAAAISGVAGGMTYGSLSWNAFMDPGGRGVIGQACNGPCALYSIADGQPVLPLRDSTGRFGTFMRLLASSGGGSGTVVRVGESWFFLTQGSNYDQVLLWRADLGIVRQIGSYFRPQKSRYSSLEPPRLVRRKAGSALGLLVTAPRTQNEAAGSWFVLPIDMESGTLDEPISLGSRDLGGVTPERCSPGQDGWLLETTLELPPIIELGQAYAALEGVELRLRLDAGSVCLEGLAARIDGSVSIPKAAKSAKMKPLDPTKVPFAATERASGERWVFQCGPTNPSESGKPGVPVDDFHDDSSDDD